MATLFDYQLRVDALVRQGKNVILQAPTGAGKTRAALFPFLAGWPNPDPANLPRQCLYAVPMRVLANQFEEEYKSVVRDYAVTYGLRRVRGVSIQSGARPEDRKLEGDLIFLTIDQLLSSFLTIPYSLSNRQSNLNAGAIISSYLVFDEFHLFPVDDHGEGALATTIHMLKMLKGVTPFVMMTATFSETMLWELCRQFDAEAVTLTQEEIDAIPSQQGKQRRYRWTGRQVDATLIADDFIKHGRQRSAVVCNTVARALTIASDLRKHQALAGVHIELLHSQFYASDRAEKEMIIRREFGEDRTKRQFGPTILVATQVIEVGLNITCEVLHTEVAPASSVIQRAGRCARFEGEHGLVLVYDVPPNTDGARDFAPYFDKNEHDDGGGQQGLCERTIAAFQTLPAEGAVLNYQAELQLVNKAHEPFDAALLAKLHDNRHTLRGAVTDVLRKQDRSAARDLIRDVDSKTLILHSNPNETTTPNPYIYEGIAVRRTRLLAWYGAVQEQALAMAVDWIAKIAHPQEASGSGSEPAEQGRRIETRWDLVLRPSTLKEDLRAARSELAAGSLIAINPILVQYDSMLGFQFESGQPAKDSPRAPKKPRDEIFSPLRRETYQEHITGLYRVYLTDLRDRTAAVRQRLA